MSIPFIDLKTQYQALKPQIQARIDAVLEHGQYIMGPEVEELEGKLAAYTGSKHCITVASGTEALLMSLMALDIKPGDEVITTPFTFVATAEVIVLLGAKPVFVDVEVDTGNIDASLIEAKITNKTKAIIPVSLYVQVADMDAINLEQNIEEGEEEEEKKEKEEAPAAADGDEKNKKKKKDK
jgi:UDP-2-acetamido-2-deoxy-ribo-hexuluronate aminotransferase